jgi:plastocyanin
MHTLNGVLAAATRLCVALALVLAPWANSMAARALAAPDNVATVTVGNGALAFFPTPQTIAVNDTIHWVWGGDFHSTTSGSCSGMTCTPNGMNGIKWDSGVNNTGFTYDVTFTATGTYSYYCSIHGPNFGMRGTIDVVDFLPITGLSAANSSPTLLGSATAFTATVSSGNPMTYTWSFGDAQAGSGALTSHTYGASGFYTAVVTASNAISTVVAFTPVTITTRIYLPLILR